MVFLINVPVFLEEFVGVLEEVLGVLETVFSLHLSSSAPPFKAPHSLKAVVQRVEVTQMSSSCLSLLSP